MKLFRFTKYKAKRTVSEQDTFNETLGDTIVCDELVKAIEGVTTNGKTKLQQG